MRLEVVKKLMKEGIIEAEIGAKAKENNRPFGAVMADHNGRVIVKAHNTTKTDHDLTAHAEMNLLKKAFKKLKTVDLSPYTLIVNAKPCSMCATACLKAGIKAFYYGLPMEKTSNPSMGLRAVSKRARGKILIKGGIDIMP